MCVWGGVPMAPDSSWGAGEKPRCQPRPAFPPGQVYYSHMAYHRPRLHPSELPQLGPDPSYRHLGDPASPRKGKRVTL